MSTASERSSTRTAFLLSAMMFLQFFVWGAWFVTLGPFMDALGFDGTAIANAYSTAPIAAILSPFILGIIADRFFASERVMGVLHLAGGGLLMLAPHYASGESQNAGWFIGVLLAHMLCYMPTLGLSNTVAFHAMTNPEKQFPLVRVWGTIGWIVAGVSVGYIAKALVTDPGGFEELETARSAHAQFFVVAGGASLLLGLFSFFLPHTPAPSKGKPISMKSILGLDALGLLRQRSFAVFIGASLLICIPLAAYYAFAAKYAGNAGMEGVPIKMTFGQMSEIVFMLVMPLFFRRLGVKWMLAIGMLAWVLRYGLFAGAWSGPSESHIWMILLGIVLHGICYDFFFVTGQIYTEKTAPEAVRAQAQGFLVLVTQGIGMLIGNQLFGRLVDRYTDESGLTDWRTVWIYPAAFAGVVLFIFIVLFREKGDPNSGSTES